MKFRPFGGLTREQLIGSITDIDIAPNAAISKSKLALAGTITDLDIAPNAAISKSKLALAGTITDLDIAPNAAISKSKLALTGAITDADIAANAAIAQSKLALTADPGYHAFRHSPGGADEIPELNYLYPYRLFVASSTVSYVDLTGLDINTHKAYLIVATIKNPFSAGLDYYMYIEGDYTNSNYYCQNLDIDNTSVTASRENAPRLSNLGAGERTNIVVYLVRDLDGYPRYFAKEVRKTGSSVIISLHAGCKTATVSNITQIRIYTVTSGISANSRIMLFRLGG
jgi:hypothetical protein